MVGGSFFLGLAIGMAAATFAAWHIQRRHAERIRMAERRARAAERMAEIGGMTGGLAHEIKNPLSTIGLNAQLIEEQIEELNLADDEHSRLTSRTRALRRETERLRGILADFLEFAGQIHLDRRPAELNGVVSDLVDFFLPEAERQGVRLRMEPGPPLTASVDIRLLKQALLNLMLNATQAMHAAWQSAAPSGAIPSPGTCGDLILRIEADREADGTRLAKIHVIDTGPGIAPDTIAKIFNPYFTTRSGGSGLGLPTCRRLIEEHGGRIDVHSDLGRGSDFMVVLPIEDAM